VNSEEKSFAKAGLLSLMFGVLAAAVLLMSQPVDDLPLREEAIKPGVAYLQSGQSGGGGSWQRKWQGWQSGNINAVDFTEGELNVWAQQNWGAPVDADSEPWFSWHQPSFRLSAEDELQIALLLQAQPPGYAREIPFWSVGRFENGAAQWSVSNGQAWVGQFPLGKVPLLGHWVASRIVQNAFRANVADEFQSAWGSPQSVLIENHQISIRR
jgi:hypothetical protein